MPALYDKGGVTIPENSEGNWLTVNEINALLDSARSVPTVDRDEFLDAVILHYRHYYDGIDAGQYQIRRKPGGRYVLYWRGYDANGDYLDGLGP